MVNIDIDFNNKIGKIKPMHAVNNGPVYKFCIRPENYQFRQLPPSGNSLCENA
ncbi:MAG: hypothetical protein ACLR23_23235 [Clostridia bacterium]